MSVIILDLGSGLSCKDSIPYVEKMIDAISEIDTHKHEVILKFQLFQDAPPNVPLNRLVFSRAYKYAKDKGYKVTASVFDKQNLDFLLNFEVPFIKIACRPDLYWLIGEVPRKILVYTSWKEAWPPFDCKRMVCIPNYPATGKQYEATFDVVSLGMAVSDHTIGLELWNKYNPSIWEKHFVLERDSSNPDSGPFACDIEQLKEIL